MPFYRDAGGAVWISDHRARKIFCVSDPTVEDDVPSVGLAMDPEEIAERFGPLVEIRPTGWEVVE
ncbi:MULTISPECIES: hypothetical protein [unclassified Streptomyces]|uniref:hypothetical protein n=1 Tax=unclassified Streptomyces TaxID=2593676 RepID=UPI0003740AD7|nr:MULTISPECIES: hypothetical protein [unclassified Streptomyces]MYY03092.1 hypothetical protein [Streptomyces sp. SID4913]